MHRGLLPLLIALAGGSAAFAHAQSDADTIRAGRFDTGKMWTFEYAPAEYFSETYGFEATPQWFTQARMATLRIGGCSASFVSPNGLLATNHHCTRSRVSEVSRPGEALLDTGFVARTLADERPIPGYYADQLIAVADVSDEVFAALDRTERDADREPAREMVVRRIETRLLAEHRGDGDSVWVQVVALYHGGRYSAYVFRRFTDIRLVAVPELQLGSFGGDPDNFTYPRYALDFAFLRVYGRDGEPHRPEHFFGWGREGVEAGDVVFVIGNPGATNRLNTIAQMEYDRDVALPATLHTFASRLRAMEAYRAAHPDEAEAIDIRNRMYSLSNSLKARTGQLAALSDPTVMGKRRDAERRLADSIRARPELAARYGEVFARIAELQLERRRHAAAYGAFRLLGNTRYGSQTLARALTVAAYLDARRAGADEAALAPSRRAAASIPDLPQELERRFLAARLAELERSYGPEHEVTRAALGDRTPEAAARWMLEYSAFGSARWTAEAVRDDGFDPEDPALRLATVLLPYYRDYVRSTDEVDRAEAALAADLGRARFDVYGRTIAPDGTSSPRITDGVVQGYAYNGTLAPPYTTFHGLYDRYYSQPHPSDWDLPARWLPAPAGLDLSTPLNFVSTADTYGGNSGSPAVTPDLALVGLNFDRNIEGLSRDYVYLPEQGRNIMVDVRAIEAVMDHVYDADRIVLELVTGRLYRSEAEADRATR